mmetsp:Transcript_47066/g.114676  ORF Transcript_47066/g.114676 Transcript_47066/m.114676 type:complete len:491 (+) Transcript_47066:255-1727(+)
MPPSSSEECRAVQVARAFFQACTKLSDDNEDILPQEDGAERLSVFCLFSELFPEFANDKERPESGKHGLMRLQFNKIGYEMYDKEQSRRVPAVRAKPGNPGYGFRRARWRDAYGEGEDARICETIMRSLGVNNERLERIKKRVNDFKIEWDVVRRPSRPAGPGRPRGHKRSPAEALTIAEAVPAIVPEAMPAAKKSKKGTSRTRSAEAAAAQEPPTPRAEPAAIPAIVIDGAPWGIKAPERAEGRQSREAEHEQELTEENSSLRALNMSLIYEREQMLVQIRHADSEVASLQEQLDKLLAVAEKRGGADLAGAFRALATKLTAKKDQTVEIPQHYQQVIETSVDAYEAAHGARAAPRDGASFGSTYGASAIQDSFGELQSDEPTPVCTEDLRELLRPMKSATRLVNQPAAACSAAGEKGASAQAWAAGAAARSSDVQHKENNGHITQALQDPTQTDHVTHHVPFLGMDVYDDHCNDLGDYAYLFNTATAF